jgi:hypothetical protein
LRSGATHFTWAVSGATPRIALGAIHFIWVQMDGPDCDSNFLFLFFILNKRKKKKKKRRGAW